MQFGNKKLAYLNTTGLKGRNDLLVLNKYGHDYHYVTTVAANLIEKTAAPHEEISIFRVGE